MRESRWEEGLGAPGRTETAVSGRTRGQQCWEEQLSNAGKRAQPSCSFQSISRARKARGLAGVSNKQLYCVPSWGASQGRVIGTAPLLLKEGVRRGLRGLARRLCSLLTDARPLPRAPFRPSLSSSQASRALKSELTVREDWQGGQIWVLAKR